MPNLKEIFYTKLQNIYSSKRDNTVIPTAVKRNQIIQQLINVDKVGAKSMEDYNLKKRFEVLHVANEYRLIKKRIAGENGFKFIIAFEGLFETSSSIHSKIGHQNIQWCANLQSNIISP